MKRLLLLPLLLGLSSPVQAGVDPEVHKLCKDVKDYLGCVKAQSGEVKLQLNEQVGNYCPSGHGYLGGGLCQFIGYFRGSIDGYGWQGDSRLLGKGWPDKRTWAGVRRPPQFLKRSAPVRASFDSRCPPIEPEIGRNNSCQNGISEEVIRTSQPPIGMDLPQQTAKKNKLPMACREGIWDKDHPKCQVKEETIMSPMDMD